MAVTFIMIIKITIIFVTVSDLSQPCVSQIAQSASERLSNPFALLRAYQSTAMQKVQFGIHTSQPSCNIILKQYNHPTIQQQ